MNSLLNNIELETGLTISSSKDDYIFSGLLNNYRPSGEGLEKLFSSDVVDGEVLTRIKKIFSATEDDWEPNDIYFVIKKPIPLDEVTMVNIAEDYLKEIKGLSGYLEDDYINDNISLSHIVTQTPVGEAKDEDFEIALYECMTDFLATLQPKNNEIFFLKECLYSIANDYFLMAYVLWPVIKQVKGTDLSFDRYFDMWKFGIKINFYEDGVIHIFKQ